MGTNKARRDTQSKGSGHVRWFSRAQQFLTTLLMPFGSKILCTMFLNIALRIHEFLGENGGERNFPSGAMVWACTRPLYIVTKHTPNSTIVQKVLPCLCLSELILAFYPLDRKLKRNNKTCTEEHLLVVVEPIPSGLMGLPAFSEDGSRLWLSSLWHKLSECRGGQVSGLTAHTQQGPRFTVAGTEASKFSADL